MKERDRLIELAPVAAAPIRHHVFGCTGKSCSARDSAEVRDAFEQELKSRGLLFEIVLRRPEKAFGVPPDSMASR